MKYYEKYKDIYIEKEIIGKNISDIDKTKFYVRYNKAHQVIILDLDK